MLNMLRGENFCAHQAGGFAVPDPNRFESEFSGYVTALMRLADKSKGRHHGTDCSDGRRPPNLPASRIAKFFGAVAGAVRAIV